MGRVSGFTVGLAAVVAVLLGLAGNVAASTLQLPSWSKPWVWAAVGVLSLAVVFIEVGRRRQGRSVAISVDLDAAAELLASAVGRSWQVQEQLWQVHDPYPLPVRWDCGSAELTDHWANIHRAAPGVDPGPLELTGRLDQIATVYTRIPSGRLVVLGRPGAGKTILAGRFVADMLTSRAPGDPVPVVFNLSTWNPDAVSLTSWLANRLVEDYPGLAGPGSGGDNLATELVATGRILPVLDGFDEIAQGLHTAAITALNRTITPLVVTSRPEEYCRAVSAADVLTAAAVISLSGLDVADLTDYLTRASAPAATGWAPVLDVLTCQPAASTAVAITEALSTPLMVYLARTVYSDTPHRDPAELLDTARFPTAATVEEHLLDAFIPAIYQSRPLDPGKQRRAWDDPAHALHWHTYLATHLYRRHTHDLAWWELYTGIPRIIRVFISTIVWGLAFGFVGGLGGGLMSGLVGGFVFGLMSGLAPHVSQPKRTRLQVRGRLSMTVRTLVDGLVVGLLGGFVFGLIGGLVGGFAFGLASGFFFLAEKLAVIPEVNEVLSPGDLLRMDRRRSLTVMLPLGAAFGLVVGFTGGLVGGFMVGLAGGLTGIRRTSTAWHQWLMLTRLWLCATGKLPWAIVAFLDDAHRRGMLRQAGGVYRYRHARLRDRLAKAPHHQAPAPESSAALR